MEQHSRKAARPRGGELLDLGWRELLGGTPRHAASSIAQSTRAAHGLPTYSTMSYTARLPSLESGDTKTASAGTQLPPASLSPEGGPTRASPKVMSWNMGRLEITSWM